MMKLFHTITKLIGADRVPVNDDLSVNWGILGRRLIAVSVVAILWLLLMLILTAQKR